jgi:hypothetical protein
VQLRPLNNLVSFLATRDLAAAQQYGEEGLAIVRRLGDREWGLNLLSSVVHVEWTAGRWSHALALIDELAPTGENSSVMALLAGYVAMIREARGEPLGIPQEAMNPLGLRADVILDAARLFLEAAQARVAGDFAAASEASVSAARKYIDTSGLDDDFPLFWIGAIEDALASGEVERAKELVELVTSAAVGHVPPYVRAQLPRLRALVQAAAGEHENVHGDFLAAATALQGFGALFYLARTKLDHAEWLVLQGRGEETTALLTEAQELFESLDATPWLLRVQQLAPTRAASAGT